MMFGNPSESRVLGDHGTLILVFKIGDPKTTGFPGNHDFGGHQNKENIIIQPSKIDNHD